jgi:hypothetical protein
MKSSQNSSMVFLPPQASQSPQINFQLSQNMHQQQKAIFPSAASMGHDKRIYIGSLAYDQTEDNVRVPFSAFGQIVKIDMPREPATGLSKGFCFLEYATAESATTAMATMNGFMIAGRPIKVNKPAGLAGEKMLPPVVQLPQQLHPTIQLGAMPLMMATPPPVLIPQFVSKVLTQLLFIFIRSSCLHSLCSMFDSSG